MRSASTSGGIVDPRADRDQLARRAQLVEHARRDAETARRPLDARRRPRRARAKAGEQGVRRARACSVGRASAAAPAGESRRPAAPWTRPDATSALERGIEGRIVDREGSAAPVAAVIAAVDAARTAALTASSRMIGLHRLRGVQAPQGGQQAAFRGRERGCSARCAGRLSAARRTAAFPRARCGSPSTPRRRGYGATIRSRPAWRRRAWWPVRGGC